MQLKTVLTAFVVLVVFGFVTVHRAAKAPDPILQSFERELNHEASPAAKARRDSIDIDVLYSIVNSPHWTPGGQGTRETSDTIDGGTDDEKQTDH